jgi:hypothetical protein
MDKLTYHTGQQAFKNAILSSDKTRIVAACGRQLGKSELVMRTLFVIAATTSSRILIYAATLSHTKDIYSIKIEQYLAEQNLKFLLKSQNQTTQEYRFRSGGFIKLGGAENLKVYEGQPWDYIVIDEAALIPPKQHPLSVGMIPTLNRTNGKVIYISTPRATGVGGAEFRRIYEEWSKLAEGENSPYSAHTWSAQGLLPIETIERLKVELSPREQQEVIYGKFTTLEGEVYYGFTEKSIVHNTNFAEDFLFISCDFNTNPMAWNFYQEQNDTLIAVDELNIRNTNTYEACQILKQKLKTIPYTKLVFYGDASGNQKRTSSTASDWSIIAQNFPNADLRFNKANPSIDYRIASVNNALRRDRMKIDSRCIELIKDLESITFKENTSQIDARDPDRTHHADNCGYICVSRLPFSMDNPIAQGGAKTTSTEVNALPLHLQHFKSPQQESVKPRMTKTRRKPIVFHTS